MGLWTWITGQDAMEREFAELMATAATKGETWGLVQAVATKTLRGRFPDRIVQRLIAWNVSGALENPALDHGGPLNSRLYEAFVRKWAETKSFRLSRNEVEAEVKRIIEEIGLR